LSLRAQQRSGLIIWQSAGRQDWQGGSFKGKNMFKTIVDLCRDQTAATAIEYGLIAALISVGAVTVLSTVGSNLTGTFSTVARKL
jgi:pilus assembly protein Flp/PilA